MLLALQGSCSIVLRGTAGIVDHSIVGHIDLGRNTALGHNIAGGTVPEGIVPVGTARAIDNIVVEVCSLVVAAESLDFAEQDSSGNSELWAAGIAVVGTAVAEAAGPVALVPAE